jgi:hypothetical protein
VCYGTVNEAKDASSNVSRHHAGKRAAGVNSAVEVAYAVIVSGPREVARQDRAG